jgi:putative Mn2+ efflux pump MntP
MALSLLSALALSLATFSVSMRRGVRALEELG